jgi:hypothetical protein
MYFNYEILPVLGGGRPNSNEFQTLTEPFCTGSYSSFQVGHDSVILEPRPRFCYKAARVFLRVDCNKRDIYMVFVYKTANQLELTDSLHNGILKLIM